MISWLDADPTSWMMDTRRTNVCFINNVMLIAEEIKYGRPMQPLNFGFTLHSSDLIAPPTIELGLGE